MFVNKFTVDVGGLVGKGIGSYLVSDMLGVSFWYVVFLVLLFTFSFSIAWKR